jgi:hypothetical protein
MEIGLGLSLGKIAVLGSAAAAVSGPSLDDLLANVLAWDAAVSGWSAWDQSTASMSEDRVAVTQVSPGGPVGQLFDRKGSLDLSASTSNSFRPAATDGLTFDGSDDRLVGAAALPASATWGGIYRGTKAQGIPLSQANSLFVLCWQDGQSLTTSNVSGTSYVDNVLVANNRDTLHAAVADGSPHIIEQRAFTGTGWTTPGISTYTGSGFPIGGVSVPLPVLDPAGANYAEALIDWQILGGAIIQQLNL